LPIKDDRPGSLRTECFELPPGKAGAAAARAVVDDLARDLGELYEDARLLVSELVTAGAERLDENIAPRLELSIHKAWLKVELLYEGADADVISLEKSSVGEWTRMLLDALTSSWGVSGRAGICLWFELRRT
jgi:FAD/FMN-containing dehydrogenase